MNCLVCLTPMTTTSVVKTSVVKTVQKGVSKIIDFKCVNCSAEQKVTQELVSGPTRKFVQNQPTP